MNEKPDKLIGVELKNFSTIAVSISDDGSIIDELETARATDQESVLHLGNVVGELKTRFGEFDRIGIAVPGLINIQTNRVAFSRSMPENAEIDLLGEIEKFSGVRINIENDANAAAYGEYRLGAGKGVKNMFYVTLGEGVGGALILDNKIWQGDSGFAGEFGSIFVNSEGTRLEELASSDAILKRTRERFHQDTTSSLNEIGEENITINDLISEARNGDDFAQLMFRRTGFYVGSAIANAIGLLNIERIVIGGEIMKAGDLILDSIISRAKELAFHANSKAAKIVPGNLGGKASAIGAALLSGEQGFNEVG